MARLNWTKSRKFKAGEYEEKYDPGTVMQNGRVVQPARQDSLAARAAVAEQQWLAEREKNRKKQRMARRVAKKKPTKAETARLKLIRRQLFMSE